MQMQTQQPHDIPPDARNMAMLAHLLGAIILFFSGIFAFVGPLAIWLMKKEEHGFIDDQGKEALNFQLSVLIYGLITVPIAVITCGIGAVLTLAVWVFGIVMGIIACIQASNGTWYRYPLSIRLVK